MSNGRISTYYPETAAFKDPVLEARIKAAEESADVNTAIGPGGAARATLEAAIEDLSGLAASRILSERPRARLQQASSGRIACGWDAVAGMLYSYNSSSLYQRVGTGGRMDTRGVPAGTDVTTGAAVEIFKGHVYLCIRDSATARFGIYRAEPIVNAGTFAWSSSLHQLKQGSTHIGTRFAAGSEYLYVGEYGDPGPGGPSVYRSNDGSTWTECLNVPTARHVHSVAEDPYNPGHIWVAMGDLGSPNAVYRSTNHGSTWASVVTSMAWQAVQISFTEERVWFASDQELGNTVWTIDRLGGAPRWESKRSHYLATVPGGRSGRRVTDLATTNASTAVSSATAAFTAADVGCEIFGPNTISDGCRIVSVQSSTEATVSIPASGTLTTAAAIGGDRFYLNAYCGIVDPATGIYYCVAADTSVSGNTGGLFALLPGSDDLTLILPMPATVPIGPLYICGTRLAFNRWDVELLQID